MALLMVGAFRGEQLDAAGLAGRGRRADRRARCLPSSAAASAASAFTGMFVADAFAHFMKVLVLIGSAVDVLIAMRYNEEQGIARFEFPVLVLLATVGMMVMISANDLITLYVGARAAEPGALRLAAFHRDRLRSTEAGLKYFVLGALVVGHAALRRLAGLRLHRHDRLRRSRQLLAGAAAARSACVIGLVFVVAGLAFKIAAVPFHMWTPDVYEGAPTPVTAFFAARPRSRPWPCSCAYDRAVRAGRPSGSQIIVFISIASMVLGAFAAIGQTNIKRLMAYQLDRPVGFALVGLAAGTASGVRGVMIYMAIYLVMTLGTLGFILGMRRSGGWSRRSTISPAVPTAAEAGGGARRSSCSRWAGFRRSPASSPSCTCSSPRSMAGLSALAVIGVLTSVVGAYYYLRIVKVMYFDEPRGALDRPIGRRAQGRGVRHRGRDLVLLCDPGPDPGRRPKPPPRRFFPDDRAGRGCRRLSASIAISHRQHQ